MTKKLTTLPYRDDGRGVKSIKKKIESPQWHNETPATEASKSSNTLTATHDDYAKDSRSRLPKTRAFVAALLVFVRIT